MTCEKCGEGKIEWDLQYHVFVCQECGYIPKESVEQDYENYPEYIEELLKDRESRSSE